MDYSNGLFDCQSPTSPFLGGLRVLHLLEDLRGALELMDNDERDNLRCQIPDSTAEGVAEWLHGRLVCVGCNLNLSFYSSDSPTIGLSLTVYCTSAALPRWLNNGVSEGPAVNSFHHRVVLVQDLPLVFLPLQLRLSSCDIVNKLLI